MADKAERKLATTVAQTDVGSFKKWVSDNLAATDENGLPTQRRLILEKAGVTTLDSAVKANGKLLTVKSDGYSVTETSVISTGTNGPLSYAFIDLSSSSTKAVLLRFTNTPSRDLKYRNGEDSEDYKFGGISLEHKVGGDWHNEGERLIWKKRSLFLTPYYGLERRLRLWCAFTGQQWEVYDSGLRS